MFFASNVRFATLASHQPIRAPSVSTRAVVKRLLGDARSRTPNINAINSLIIKTESKGLVGTASVLGRAMFFLKRRNPEGAIVEVDRVFPAVSDDALRRLAIGIRLRARNDILDLKESSLKVHGGTSELEISEIRAALRGDYKVMEEASPGCWLFQLAAAEYLLYDGAAKDGYDSLRLVQKSIEEYILSLKGSLTSQNLQNPVTHVSLLLAFQLGRAHALHPTKVSSRIIHEALITVMNGPDTKESVSAFKAEMGTELTDEEMVELVYIFEAAHIRHHFHDYFPLGGEYNCWWSERSSLLRDILSPDPTPAVIVDVESLSNVRKTMPHQPFYASEGDLRRFLSCSHKNVIAELRETFGLGPKTPLVKSEDAYFDTLRAIQGSPLSVDAAGTAAYSIKQVDACRHLAQQLLYRTQVNTAVALTQLDRLEEALSILNDVVNADEYIYMWRAFLARGEANKRFGHIGNSDKDFRELSKLKRNVPVVA